MCKNKKLLTRRNGECKSVAEEERIKYTEFKKEDPHLSAYAIKGCEQKSPNEYNLMKIVGMPKRVPLHMLVDSGGNHFYSYLGNQDDRLSIKSHDTNIGGSGQWREAGVYIFLQEFCWMM